jgi:hypothetical protein
MKLNITIEDNDTLEFKAIGRDGEVTITIRLGDYDHSLDLSCQDADGRLIDSASLSIIERSR